LKQHALDVRVKDAHAEREVLALAVLVRELVVIGPLDL
jgi:hypothetical protein